MSKKFHFRGPFDKQDGKRVQALFKSALQRLYHILIKALSVASELVSLNCPYEEQDIFHRQTMC